MYVIPQRYYQRDGVNVLNQWTLNERTDRVVSMPTGSGKTRTAIGECNQEVHRTEKALVIEPTIDLVHQTARAFREFYALDEIGVVQGQNSQLGRWVTIASASTIARPERLDELMDANHQRPFSKVIIDEAHGSLTKMYQTILERVCGAYTTKTGYSATPYRSDGQNLVKVFRHGLAYSVDLFTLIAQGYLADLHWYDFPTTLDISHLTVGGAFNTLDEMPDDVRAQVERSNRYHVAWTAYNQLLKGKPTLIFAQDLTDAQGFSTYFEKHGKSCKVVDGKTSRDNRGAYYQALELGETVIANYNVLTTGVDFPCLAGIILGRTTDNRGPIHQILGRGMRMCEETGKEYCTVVNLTDRHHVLCSMTSLIGRDATGGISLRAALQEKLKDEVRTTRKEEVSSPYDIRLSIQELHISAYNAFTGDGWKGDPLTGCYSKDCGKYGTLQAERGFTGYTMTHIAPNGRHKRLSTEDLGLDMALYTGVQHIEELKEREKINNGTSANLQKPVLPGQLKYLTNRKVFIYPKNAEGMTQAHYVEMKRLIEEHDGAWDKERKLGLSFFYGRVRWLPRKKKSAKESLSEGTTVSKR